MEITVTRRWRAGDATIGELAVDGTAECFTLEDEVRDGDIFLVKIQGGTAIPAGRYAVIITHSPHFDRDLPLLVGVPDFEGVRIHPGNKAADTDGCLLVGKTRLGASIGNSRAAFDVLFPKIQAAIAGGQTVSISIRNDFEETA